MIRKLIYTIAAVALGLFALEAIARLVEFKAGKSASSAVPHRGWQTEFFSRIFDWHEPDPELLWRFKANLDNPLIKTNSEHLLGDNIPPGKEKSRLRLLMLGDSSPVGLGLPSRQQAFPEILSHMLQAALAGNADIELINASVAGYTSEQILRFLERKGWAYEPDIILLYCGNNDASISGTYSDRELFQQQKFVSIRKLLYSSSLYRLLFSFLKSQRESFEPEISSLKVRVSPTEFRENLEAISLQCRAHRVPLIIMKPPVPYLWPAGLQFRPFAHLTGEDGQLLVPAELSAILGREIKYCLDTLLFRRLYGEVDFFTRTVYQSAYNDSMNLDSAVEFYRGQLRGSENDPSVWNNLGVTFWQRKEFAQADHYLKTARQVYCSRDLDRHSPVFQSGGTPFLYNIGINLLSQSSIGLHDTAAAYFRYLDSALQADYFSLRIKKEYTDIIDRLAGENITVIDLPKLFAERGGEKLFIDHCHPTAEGHRLIAELLADRILSGRLVR